MSQTYTHNSLKLILQSGTVLDWETLKSNLDLSICAQIKSICEPFNNVPNDLIHPYWYGIAHKFECNEASKKRLQIRNERIDSLG